MALRNRLLPGGGDLCYFRRLCLYLCFCAFVFVAQSAGYIRPPIVVATTIADATAATSPTASPAAAADADASPAAAAVTADAAPAAAPASAAAAAEASGQFGQWSRIRWGPGFP